MLIGPAAGAVGEALTQGQVVIHRYATPRVSRMSRFAGLATGIDREMTKQLVLEYPPAYEPGAVPVKGQFDINFEVQQ